MARCKVCEHELVAEINQQLMTGISLRAIGKTYGLAATTIKRHKDNCIFKQVSKAIIQNVEKQEVRHITSAMDILDNLGELEKDARELFLLAREDGQLGVAMTGIDKLAKIQDSYLKFAAEARAQQKENEAKQESEMEIVIDIMMGIIRDYPEVYERFEHECRSRKIITN